MVFTAHRVFNYSSGPQTQMDLKEQYARILSE